MADCSAAAEQSPMLPNPRGFHWRVREIPTPQTRAEAIPPHTHPAYYISQQAAGRAPEAERRGGEVGTQCGGRAGGGGRGREVLGAVRALRGS